MIHSDELSVNAMGGTEMMKGRLQSAFDGPLSEFKNKVQIVVSRERKLKEGIPAYFWAHDLENDPEAINALSNGSWQKYKKIIFVSHWQRDRYMQRFSIPQSRTRVISNVVDAFPIDVIDKKSYDTINLIYTPTPHRGLDILYYAFAELCNHFDNLHLDVFSSFELYGWSDRDRPYQKLFELLNAHPNITYHGTKSNEIVRQKLKETNVFAYPSIWQETSGITLMEAMASGNLIVAPDLAAIPETTFRLAHLYNYDEDVNTHLQLFYSNLYLVIRELINDPTLFESKLRMAKSLSFMYNEDTFISAWRNIFSD